MEFKKDDKNAALVASQQNEVVEYRRLLVSRGLALIDTLEKRTTSYLREEYDRYYELANEYRKQGEYDKAISFYTKCIRIDDYLGQAYAEYNSCKVVEYLKNSKTINVYIGRGLCYSKTSDYVLAAGDYSMALILDPQHAQALEDYDNIFDKLPEGLQKLVIMGEDKGFLTYDEVNTMLPSDIVLSDEIDGIILLFGAKNIDIIDEEKGERIILNKDIGLMLRRKMTILMSFRLGIEFSELLNDLGYKVLWSSDPDNLRELARINHIDVALEWQWGETDFSVRDMLRQIGKSVPIIMCRNWKQGIWKNDDDLRNQGYAAAVDIPFKVEEFMALCERLADPKEH